MYYKVTFSKWFDYETPMFEGLSIEEIEDMEKETGEYLVKADNKEVE